MSTLQPHGDPTVFRAVGGSACKQAVCRSGGDDDRDEDKITA